MSREELWYCIRNSGDAEKYARVEQDMYMDYEAVERCAFGVTGVQGGGGTPPVPCSHYR